MTFYKNYRKSFINPIEKREIFSIKYYTTQRGK